MICAASAMAVMLSVNVLGHESGVPPTYCDMSTHCCIAQQGLSNRALLGSRPVNKVPRRHDDVTFQEYGNVTCVYVVARRRAAILSDCNGSGGRDVTVLLSDQYNRC
jgi:hypothetical protein